MSRDLRPFSQWPKPKVMIQAPEVIVGLWAEDVDEWMVLDQAGAPLAEDADGFLVLSTDPEAVTLRRTRLVNSETIAVS